MTTAPVVELRFNPTDLRPRDLPTTGAFLGSPADAIEAALAVTRAAMVDQMRDQARGLSEPSHAQLVRLADLAWQGLFWKFRKISAPVLADAYIRAYRAAEAGDVPMSVIYDLAEKHAEKIGDYFHATSRDALAEGFTTMVNRRVPAKVATDRVLDAYGLTPRQMRSYVSGSQQFNTPISDVMPRSLKAKARAYVDKAFTSRTRKLSRQEEHNIDEQAKQFAWMWLQDKGRLTDKAEKIWITARDERVCPVCGPLHGQKVRVNEQFKSKEGSFWTPGLHPNCRCVIRLIENRFSKALGGTALGEFNREHPREQHGRFSAKARTRPPKTLNIDEEFKRIINQPVQTPSRHITYAQPSVQTAPPEVDTEAREQFAALIEAQPETRGFTSVWTSPIERDAFRDQALATIADPEALLDFEADLILDLREAVQNDPDLPSKAPTVPLAQPAYAVLGYQDLQDGDIGGPIKLNHGIEFSTDEIAKAQEAGELIRQTVTHRIDDMIDDGAVVSMVDKETGQWYEANLSPQTVDRVAQWYANTATAHWHDDYDPNFIGDERVRLNWQPSRTAPEVEDYRYIHGVSEAVSEMPLSWIGRQFDIRSEDFETYLVRIDRAPAAEGAVEQISGGPHSRHQSFTIDGNYELVPGSVSKTMSSHAPYAVTTFKAEPVTSVMLPKRDVNNPDASE